MQRDALPPPMAVRAEAMRLAIECGKAFDDGSPTELMVLAEQFEAWLYEAKAPSIVRPCAEDLRRAGVNGHA